MSNQTYTNPWAGLSSYQDPESADVQLKFCGRDNESFDVAQLIDDNIFVTLYGKSGTGKTSLLNAGVFPRLRQEQYLPVSIRLGMEAFDISFQQCVLAKISQALQGKGTQTSVEVVPMPTDEQSTEYLWSYFARTRFLAADGSTLFPVLVFDQFEEVFRNRRDETETLLRQIHFMMDENHALSDRIVDGQPYQYDFNFRFVASIREDDLYRLEDSIDNCYLPELKRCRYRLRSLSEQGASDVILIPGEGLFKAEEQKDIVDKIVSKSRNEDGSISTNIVSLLCSRIYADYQHSGADHISPTLVDSFLKGNPFEQFYNEATRGFSNHEKSYIEDHLIDSTGRRNSVPEGDFLRYVKNGAVLMEGSLRILQRTNTSSDSNNYRVELIHDSFCEPLEGQKGIRKQRRRFRVFAITILVACCVIGGAWFYMAKLQEANGKMKENAIRFAAEKVISLTDDGDSYSARMLALSLLPDNVERHAYLPEAEYALRYACAHKTAILQGHTSAVNDVCYSEDGNNILSGASDNTIKLWDANTGECLKTFEGHMDEVLKVAFCPDGKTIISASEDNTVKIWDIKTGNIIKEFEVDVPDEDSDNPFYYSLSKKFLFLWLKNDPIIVDAHNYKCIKKIDEHILWKNVNWFPDDQYLLVYTSNRDFYKVNVLTGKMTFLLHEKENAALNSMTVDPYGSKIAAAFGYDDVKPGIVRVWNAQSGKLLHTLCSNEIWVNGVAFSYDGKRLASTSMGGQVMLWDAMNGACINVFKGHTFASGSPVFSPDDHQLVTGSAESTIRIWDIDCGQDSLSVLNTNKRGGSVKYTPDGKGLLLASIDGLSLYDSSSKRCLNTFCNDTVFRPVFAPNGKSAAVIFIDNSFGIIDISSNKWKKMKGHTAFVTAISFSHDGKRIVSASFDKTIRVWDIASGRCLHVIKWPKIIWDAVWIGHDDRILIESDDGSICIWDIQKNKTINSWNALANPTIVLSPDKKTVLTRNDKVISAWNIDTGKCIAILQGHKASIYSMCFSSDGKYVVSTDHDLMVKVWDWKREICVFSKVMSQYLSVAFSPDGSHIALTDFYDTHILDFPPLQELIDQTRERFKNRKLTPDERRKYYLE